MQTGPSVFINTQSESVKQIEDKIKELGFEYITSKIGGPTKIIQLEELESINEDAKVLRVDSDSSSFFFIKEVFKELDFIRFK